MRTHLPVGVVFMLAACGTTPSETTSTSGTEGGRMALALAPTAPAGDAGMRSYESTDVDDIPDITLDRPFTYLVRYKASATDVRVLLSTVIPHKEGITYKLVDESLKGENTWVVTFQASNDATIARGLFVHTGLGIPSSSGGHEITEVEIAVLDQAGVSTAQVGGGAPKTKKPMLRRLHLASDEDPTLPPLEDVTIYANGNLCEDEQIVMGFGQVNGVASGLSLANDVTTATVTFSGTTGGTNREFLYFEKEVTEFRAAPANCSFRDGDGDRTTDPRPNVLEP